MGDVGEVLGDVDPAVRVQGNADPDIVEPRVDDVLVVPRAGEEALIVGLDGLIHADVLTENRRSHHLVALVHVAGHVVPDVPGTGHLLGVLTGDRVRPRLFLQRPDPGRLPLVVQ